MFVNTAMEEGEIAAPAEPARRKAATTASLNISKKNATRLKRVGVHGGIGRILRGVGGARGL